jgi:hypothetical protein
MTPHFRYLRTVIKHKYYVFIAGFKFGVPLYRLIIHDWSKFLPSEWFPYVDKFERSNDSLAFEIAWLKHKHRNPHHWEYWVDNEGDCYLPPPSYLREMVADWMAAGKAYEGEWPTENNWVWYTNNQHKIRLKGAARVYVEELMKRI